MVNLENDINIEQALKTGIMIAAYDNFRLAHNTITLPYEIYNKCIKEKDNIMIIRLCNDKIINLSSLIVLSNDKKYCELSVDLCAAIGIDVNGDVISIIRKTEKEYKKQIHFYKYNNPCAIHSWEDTEKAIDNNFSVIHTTQMGLLSTELFKSDYRIFIHDAEDDIHEIKLGEDERTGKWIRACHNIFKMWRCNHFAKDDE